MYDVLLIKINLGGCHLSTVITIDKKSLNFNSRFSILDYFYYFCSQQNLEK